MLNPLKIFSQYKNNKEILLSFAYLLLVNLQFCYLYFLYKNFIYKMWELFIQFFFFLLMLNCAALKNLMYWKCKFIFLFRFYVHEYPFRITKEIWCKILKEQTTLTFQCIRSRVEEIKVKIDNRLTVFSQAVLFKNYKTVKN